MLNFPLSYICLKVGFAPESTYVVAIAVAVMCMISRLLFLRKSAALPMSGFLKRVVLNVAMVLACSIMVPLLIHELMPYGWERFLVVGTASVVMSILSVLFVGCNRSERTFIIQKALSIKDKFRR